MRRLTPLSDVIAALKTTGLTLIILIYAVTAVRLDSMHGLFHVDDHYVAHQQENEQDPCHRAIYHQDKSGCHHQAHFSKASTCEFCDISTVSDHVNIPPRISITEEPLLRPLGSVITTDYSSPFSFSAARAPPLT